MFQISGFVVNIFLLFWPKRLIFYANFEVASKFHTFFVRELCFILYVGTPLESPRTVDCFSQPFLKPQFIWIDLSFFLQKADLAVADLTITYERETGVDFTMPFMNLGRKRYKQSSDISLTIFLSWRRDYSVHEADGQGPQPVLVPVSPVPGRVDLHGHGVSGGVAAALHTRQVGRNGYVRTVRIFSSNSDGHKISPISQCTSRGGQERL